MKKIFLLLIFTVVACKAQTSTVYSLQNYDFGSNLPNGAYVKDTYNDFNKFEGTWKYQIANQVFILKLRKKVRFYDNMDNIYIDLLAGEYQYFLNNIEVINTLANLSNDSDVYSNNISGHSFIPNANFPSCGDCNPTERRVKLSFSDPDRPWVMAYIVLRYLNSNGVEKIDATIYYTSTVVPDDGTPTTLRVPVGNFVFVKQ